MIKANVNRMGFLKDMSIEKLGATIEALNLVASSINEVKDLVEELHVEATSIVKEKEAPVEEERIDNILESFLAAMGIKIETVKPEEEKPVDPFAGIKEEMYKDALLSIDKTNKKFGFDIMPDSLKEMVARQMSEQTFDGIFGKVTTDLAKEIGLPEGLISPAEFFSKIFKENQEEVPSEKELKYQNPKNCDNDCANCSPFSHKPGAFDPRKTMIVKKRTVGEIIQASDFSSDKKIVAEKLMKDLAVQKEVRIKPNSAWTMFKPEEVTSLFSEFEDEGLFSIKFVFACDDCGKDFVVSGHDNDEDQECPYCDGDDTYLRDVVLFAL